jgi:hypothetical protein
MPTLSSGSANTPQPASPTPLAGLRLDELTITYNRDPARWRTAVQPVIAAIRTTVGTTATIVTGPDDYTITAEWDDGPSVTSVTEPVDELLNHSPRGWGEQNGWDRITWRNLTAVMRRNLRDDAYAIAAIAATIAVGCSRCDRRADDPWRAVYRLHLDRTDPHLPAAHPNLAIAIPAGRLTRAAGVIGVLLADDARSGTGMDENEIIRQVCRHGHLAGLLDTADLLNR